MTGLSTAARFLQIVVPIALCLCAGAAFGAPPQNNVPAARASQAEAAAEAGVRITLQKYEAALESLDPDAVRKVQPSVRLESLAKAFRDMRELKVDIDNVRVLSVEGSVARISCRVTQTLTPRVGSKQNSTVSRVMRLRYETNVWVIEGFER